MKKFRKSSLIRLPFSMDVNKILGMNIDQNIYEFPYYDFSLRSVHEAYQYLVQKKKKMSGRSMQENWNLGRRKSVGVALLSLANKDVGFIIRENISS